jgi:ParB-like chromosome segregation protein Spo0J
MTLPKLREIEVSISDLCLDPNNPRFADLQDRFHPVPVHRIGDTGVQDKALKRIMDERFEVRQLKDSIRTIGFLIIDRLVVTPLPNAKYLVVEGNRRVGAVKSLLEDHTNGEVDLTPEIQTSLSTLPVLVLEEEDAAKREHLARVLQGVRHVSGIRAWGPYQQAQIVALMLDDGREQSEICEILGLPRRRINILRRCFYALKQMHEDADFGDEAKPNLFSMFDEVFKFPKLRDWLDWDDERNVFLNEEHLKMLYAWLVGLEDENGNRQPAKIVDPKEIRKLPQLMADALQFKRFCDLSNLRVDEAMEGVIAPRSQIPWQSYVDQMVSMLQQVPAVDLESAKPTDEDLLTRARDLCVSHLKIIKNARS